jgi:hypothetical protein
MLAACFWLAISTPSKTQSIQLNDHRPTANTPETEKEESGRAEPSLGVEPLGCSGG